jgi:hypothetical protein
MRVIGVRVLAIKQRLPEGPEEAPSDGIDVVRRRLAFKPRRDR